MLLYYVKMKLQHLSLQELYFLQTDKRNIFKVCCNGYEVVRKGVLSHCSQRGEVGKAQNRWTAAMKALFFSLVKITKYSKIYVSFTSLNRKSVIAFPFWIGHFYISSAGVGAQTSCPFLFCFCSMMHFPLQSFSGRFQPHLTKLQHSFSLSSWPRTEDAHIGLRTRKAARRGDKRRMKGGRKGQFLSVIKPF